MQFADRNLNLEINALNALNESKTLYLFKRRKCEQNNNIECLNISK